MKYEQARKSLMTEAPIGVGGKCPICNGNLDGMCWVKSETTHDERCTKCSKLVTLKEGKVVGDYTQRIKEHKDYIRRQKIYSRIEDLEEEKDDLTFFEKMFTKKERKINKKIIKLRGGYAHEIYK